MKLESLLLPKVDETDVKASLLREAAKKFVHHPSTASLTWVEARYKAITEAKNVYSVFVQDADDHQWYPHATYLREYDAAKTLISLRQNGERAEKLAVERTASDWHNSTNIQAAQRLLESKR